MTLLCPNCRETLAEPAMYEGDLFVAVECPVCGVRGPIRPLMDKSRFEQVGKLAMDDWNVLFKLATAPKAAGMPETIDERIDRFVGSIVPYKFESNETSDTGEDVTPSSKQPAVDTPEKAATPPQPGEGGEGASQDATRKRLTRFLSDTGLTADGAFRKGMNFGVSKASVYKFLQGKRMRLVSLVSVNAALDKMERSRKLSGAASQEQKVKRATVQDMKEEDPAGEVGPSLSFEIETIPSNFKEPTGINRCPAPTAPPRCGKTP